MITPSPMRSLSFLALTAFSAILAALSAGVGDAQAQRGRISPETATGLSDTELATAKHFMVSAANRYAAEAGREMLRSGGSAVDAAIATQLVLGLVEPQSSGLGGGAFIVHYDAGAKTLATYDGRETAPDTAQQKRFLDDNGKPLSFMKVVNSGLSIGVPGTVRLLEHAHRRHGKLPWADLFQPAVQLAETGFRVSSRLNLLLRWVGPDKFSNAAKAYFFDGDGNARAIGSTLANPAYAQTLKAIATHGSAAFYSGWIANEIVAAVTNAQNFKSDMTGEDLARYQVKERPAVCTPYRKYKVCGMGPPSSGGPAIVQILKLIEPFALGTTPDDAMAAAALHIIAEAEKLAYADRNRYLADPDYVSIPPGLLDDTYLAKRRKKIDSSRAMPPPSPGKPRGAEHSTFGVDFSIERSGTSHISIIDRDGNTVSMTTTIEGAFGSGHWAAGFLLNNELTDFSFRPKDQDGRAVANRVQGGKRPRSTMAPMIVFDSEGNVFAALGSPGGGRIILYVTKALIALLDWNLDARQAAALPNFGSMGKTFDIEYDFNAIWHALKMKGFGHRIRPDLMNSGLHIVVRRRDHLEGAADPRREGAALGD